jgi:hypothetical protein
MFDVHPSHVIGGNSRCCSVGDLCHGRRNGREIAPRTSRRCMPKIGQLTLENVFSECADRLSLKQ